MFLDTTMTATHQDLLDPTNTDRADTDRINTPILDTVRMVLNVPFASIVFPHALPQRAEINTRIAELVDCAIALGTPVAVPDIAHQHRPAKFSSQHRPVRGMIAAPFVTRRKQRGALVAFDVVPRTFNERETAILAQFARCIISELELSHRADTDDLTGLMRRQPFTAALGDLVDEHVRSSTPAVLAIADLDHFKCINDSFGHATGDEVLRMVAEAMQHALGRDAMVCRLGGEEFGIALPGQSVDAALPVLERVRRAIATMAIPGHDGVSVTASFGIAALGSPLTTASGWFGAADSALYAAKQSGRNQIRVGRRPHPGSTEHVGEPHKARRGDRGDLSIAI